MIGDKGNTGGDGEGLERHVSFDEPRQVNMAPAVPLEEVAVPQKGVAMKIRDKQRSVLFRRCGGDFMWAFLDDRIGQRIENDGGDGEKKQGQDENNGNHNADDQFQNPPLELPPS
jgi:hypothetical protein